MASDMVPLAGLTSKSSLMDLNAPPPLPATLNEVRKPGIPSPSVRTCGANEDAEAGAVVRFPDRVALLFELVRVSGAPLFCPEWRARGSPGRLERVDMVANSS